MAVGADPAADRGAAVAADAAAALERRRQAQADALTFGKLIELWEAGQLAHRSERHRREAPRALRNSLARLLMRPARAIDAATVRRALETIPHAVVPLAAGPAANPAAREARGKALPASAMRGETMARRVRAYGAALYGWAVRRELVPDNPFAAVRIDSRDVPRDRVLTDAELGEIWRGAGELGWPWASYLRFLLLTLQREAETAGLAWAELAPEFSTWELPGTRTKNGRPHIVHLAEPARAILRAVPRVAGSPLAFTTTGVTPLSGFAHAKLRLVRKIEVERARAAAEARREAEPLAPWRLHDFRRTGVTALARQGVRWEVADRLLNHVQGAIRGVAAIYQRHDFLAEREAALNLWAAHVLAVAESAERPGNVVVLRGG